MKKFNTGEIYRIFKSGDKDTMIRKTNIRDYCKKEKLDYTICQSHWLINFDDFMTRLNPKGYNEVKKLPRIRTKASSMKEWNRTHKTQIKHYIVDCICDSGRIFVYKNGRHNIINYDELEQELERILREKGLYLDDENTDNYENIT